jgi:glucokinase
MTTAIGIHVGESGIRAGVVHLENGDVLCRREIQIDAARSGMAAMADVLHLAEEWLDESCAAFTHPAAIGLCVCEDVDRDGAILSGRRVAWRGLPVRRLLTQLAPAQVDTAVRSQARAEGHFGIGRGGQSFLYADVGSTIRACLVLEGRPYVGFDGTAVMSGEMPYTVFSERGQRVRSVLDDVASIDAIVRRCQAANIEQIFSAAKRSDAGANAVLQMAGEALGAALGYMCAVFDPQSLVVGGGLSCAPSIYWEALEAGVRAHMRNHMSRRLVVRQAMAGPDAGIIGAALLAGEGLVD